MTTYSQIGRRILRKEQWTSPDGITYRIVIHIPSATITKRAWYWRRYDKQDHKSGNKHKCINSPALLSLIFPWQNPNHCYTNTAYSIQVFVQPNIVNKNMHPTHWSYPKFLTTNLILQPSPFMVLVLFSHSIHTPVHHNFTHSPYIFRPWPYLVSDDALASKTEHLEEIFHQLSPHLATFLHLHLLMPVSLCWLLPLCLHKAWYSLTYICRTPAHLSCIINFPLSIESFLIAINC